MSIRLSGLISGMDTDSLVKGLSSAYQLKIDSAQKKKTKAEWKMESWNTMNSKIYSFYSGSLSKIKTYGKYKTMKASVSGAKDGAASATVKADTNAVEGNYKMKVISTATSAFLTGADLSSKSYTAYNDATDSTKFSDMYKGDNTPVESLNGQSLTINYEYYEQKTDESGEKLFSLYDKDGKQQKIQIYTVEGYVEKEVTEATEAQIKSYLYKRSQNDSEFNKKDYTTEKAIDTSESAKKTGTVTYTFNSDSSVADINEQIKDIGLKVEMQNGKLTFVNNAGYEHTADGEVGQNYGTYTINATDTVKSTFGLTDNMQAVITGTKTNTDGKVTYTVNTKTSASNVLTSKADNVAIAGSSKLGQIFASEFSSASNTETDADSKYNGQKYLEFSLTVNGEAKTIRMYENETINEFCSSINEQSGGKLNASFDKTNQRFFINTKETGAKSQFELAGSGTDSTTASNVLAGLGLIEGAANPSGSIPKMIKGTDCEIEFNNATYKSSTNSIRFDSLGLTVNAENADPDTELTVSVTKDTSAVYQMVKDFIKEYNDLVKEMSGSYYAEESDNEDPLTEEEQGEMTDAQIDRYEKEAKAATLRRDSELGSIMTSMRSILSSTVTVTNSDGTKTNSSLSAIGIVTGNWLEYGKLHINGDEDDAEYADYDNKLKETIESNPDLVMNTLAQLGNNLYTQLGQKMKSTDSSSWQKVFSDKSMKKQISDYSDQIEELKEKMLSIQERYYKQFSAMEVALSKLESTSSSLGFNNSNS